MPRNSSGTYSLPSGNPVVSNTLIQSTWANTTMSDLGSSITDSLDRNGRGAMLAPLKNTDGTQVAPAMTFSSEGTLGLYRVSAGVLGFAAGGVLVLSLSAAGLVYATPLVIPQGTAPLPALAFVANTNTGIYSPGTNQVAVSTNGVQRLTVDATGNVVVATGGVTLTAGSLTLGTGAIVLQTAGANFITAQNAAGTLQFQTGGANTRLTIDAAGNSTFAGLVGIGVSPSTPLHVWRSAANAVVRISSSGGGGRDWDITSTTTGILSFGSDLAANQVTLQSGNVGFATTPSPWGTIKAIEGTAGALAFNASAAIYLTQNVYNNGAGWIYKTTGSASVFVLVGNQYQWFNVPSGTAGAAATLTQAMTLDGSGNLGFGVTPSAWGATYKAVQFGVSGFSSGRTGNETMFVGSGAYNDGANWRYLLSGNNASFYQQASGVHSWVTAPVGTAGNVVGFTQAMTLDASGYLLVGTTTTHYGAGGRGVIESAGTSAAVFGLTVAGVAAGYMLHDGTNLSVVNTSATGSLSFLTNSLARLTIANTGAITLGGTLSMGAFILTSSASESFRTSNDAGFISIFNTAGTTRTGYLQGNAGSNLTLTSETGALVLSCLTGAVNLQAGGSNRLTISALGVIADGAGLELGWKDIPINNQTAGYTLVIGDRGRQVLITTGGVTVPQSVFLANNVVTIVNNSAVAQTITQGAGVTLHQAGTTTTGNRTLLAWGIASVLCIGSNVFVISGNIT